jgi:hypothetical protein
VHQQEITSSLDYITCSQEDSVSSQYQLSFSFRSKLIKKYISSLKFPLKGDLIAFLLHPKPLYCLKKVNHYCLVSRDDSFILVNSARHCFVMHKCIVFY